MSQATTRNARRRVVAIAADLADDLSGSRALPRTISGAIEWGRRLGWEMVDLSNWSMRMPKALQADGVITNFSYPSRAIARRLHKAFPNSVHIDSDYLPNDTAGVMVDQAASGVRAAEYLLARGFRAFAISGFRRAHWSESLLAFQDRVRMEGASCGKLPSLSSRVDVELPRKGDFFRSRLAKLKLPLAIFCRNDRLAARVCGWCLEAGLEVPEQVAILGAGNDFMSCECSPVPISSLDYAHEQRGAEAARLLERMMNGETPPSEPILMPPGDVVTRRSTDILAISNLASARALRYIWDHYREDIGVDQIAAAAATPRRSLDRHFRASIGRSVNQELSRQRLLKAAELLSTTELLAEDVAAMSGYHTAQYFNLKFKRTFGVTPRRYRLRERESATVPVIGGIGDPSHSTGQAVLGKCLIGSSVHSKSRH